MNKKLKPQWTQVKKKNKSKIGDGNLEKYLEGIYFWDSIT